MSCTLEASILINSGDIFDIIVSKGILAILDHNNLNWWEINSVVSDCRKVIVSLKLIENVTI